MTEFANDFKNSMDGEYEIVTLQLNKELAYCIAGMIQGYRMSPDASYTICTANIRRLADLLDPDLRELLKENEKRLHTMGSDQVQRVGSDTIKEMERQTKTMRDNLDK